MQTLPLAITKWFKDQRWSLHPHQQEVFERSAEKSLLLIAPTGGGKTMAGFLPTLADLMCERFEGLHTIYVSPLKALTADIRRNLMRPIEGLGLNIRVEDRTGDTSQTLKRRQRVDPPQILLTTPESLALLISYEEAPKIFSGLQRVIVDEAHALSESKRGDQLMLALSRLERLAPNMRRMALSATVDDPRALANEFAPHPATTHIVLADPGPPADIRILSSANRAPWSGGGGRYAIPDILKEIANHKTTLVFHNTRAQAEIFFHHLWMENESDLPIGIHHGSLSKDARASVENAMVNGELRAVVCTGSLDLGIDWGNVDLVIQVGAPKNVKRLVQRIGRSNHRYNAPSKALLVPANQFEIVECVAALEASGTYALDKTEKAGEPLDVLCQHILIRACSGPFDADELFEEMRTVGAFKETTRRTFDECLDFCATGGYALRAYDKWQRLTQRPDRLWQLRDPRAAARIRMNIGTIQDTDTLKVKMRGGGRTLGEVEEAFAATLTPGETFMIGGQIVKYEAMRELTVQVSRSQSKTPRVAVFSGTKFATSLELSERILRILNNPEQYRLPEQANSWIDLQQSFSEIPKTDSILIECFPHDGRCHACLYGFAGRNAQQTLGLLVTHRMEKLGLAPLGFVATDYATLIWGLEQVDSWPQLLNSSTLREDLDGWLAGNAVMKRTFRSVSTIAGLIERNSPQHKKTGRQATFSSDILYDTLRKYDPDHLMLKITRREALAGLVDFGRIEEMLERTKGRINVISLAHVSPLAAPMLLEVGKVPIYGEGRERLEAETAQILLRTAGLE
ncbi:MAG: ligase-associated DNA damage response DEXH box helicase [Marivivens sp.]|nr:ligase-associated DNA damage response DEXH box helicase [Marivivens sp.]